jgi:hypothetical protein
MPYWTSSVCANPGVVSLCIQTWDKLRQALSSPKAAPIRIKWIYQFDQGWLTPARKAAIQNNYIPETTAFFQHYLKVCRVLLRVWV